MWLTLDCGWTEGNEWIKALRTFGINDLSKWGSLSWAIGHIGTAVKTIVFSLDLVNIDKLNALALIGS